MLLLLLLTYLSFRDREPRVEILSGVCCDKFRFYPHLLVLLR